MTLVEVVVCLVVFAALSAGLTYLAGAIVEEGQKPSVPIGDYSYIQAPDIRALNSAIDAHRVFTEMRFAADATLVFGGSSSHPSIDPTGPSSVLEWGARPINMAGMANADPFRQFSSWEQRIVNAAGLTFVDAGSPADFTVVFVQGLTRVIGVARQRRFNSTLDGRAIVCYDVEVERYTFSGDTYSGSQTLGYHVFYRAAEDGWRSPPGARHVWSRIDPIWGRCDEAGAFLVFVDPYVAGGDNPDAALLPISQFSYFVPVTN